MLVSGICLPDSQGSKGSIGTQPIWAVSVLPVFSPQETQMFEKGFFIRPFSLFLFTWVLAFLAAPEVLFSILETSWAVGWAGMRVHHNFWHQVHYCQFYPQRYGQCPGSTLSFSSETDYPRILPWKKARRMSKYLPTTSSFVLPLSRIIPVTTRKLDLKSLKRFGNFLTVTQPFSTWQILTSLPSKKYLHSETAAKGEWSTWLHAMDFIITRDLHLLLCSHQNSSMEVYWS